MTALGGGTWTFGITLNTAGNFTVTATDVTDGSKTANTTSTITVQGIVHGLVGRRRGQFVEYLRAELVKPSSRVAFINGDTGHVR